MSQRTLVTGFGPFLSVRENPSGRLAECSGRPFRILEVSYEAVREFLRDLDPNSFDRLLMIGVSGRAQKMLLETQGHNRCGHTPDVRGYLPRRRKLDPSGPWRERSTLWKGAVRPNGRPEVAWSGNAGGYLCNFALYSALRAFPDKAVGFLHIPPFEVIPFERQSAVLSELLNDLERAAKLPNA